MFFFFFDIIILLYYYIIILFFSLTFFFFEKPQQNILIHCFSNFFILSLFLFVFLPFFGFVLSFVLHLLLPSCRSPLEAKRHKIGVLWQCRAAKQPERALGRVAVACEESGTKKTSTCLTTIYCTMSHVQQKQQQQQQQQ